MTNSYIAFYQPGRSWIKGSPLRDQPLEPHLEYLLALRDRGSVTAGGPFRDGSGGIVIFSADDIVEVNQLVARDPAIVDGILTANVKEWTRIA